MSPVFILKKSWTPDIIFCYCDAIVYQNKSWTAVQMFEILFVHKYFFVMHLKNNNLIIQ